ncbi:natterin-4-like [Varroa destructor]|uniref:Uncharacterized protein n=1 Tax=Varroa destructor TaxID=109461 RepID=A0A7M7KFQ8_VARDE|nr:natterin-4-like [Varroa destructor]XP_022662889.1 natterin-4-like [Varroa destructor]XP_022662891.1 natterin-4-like [Varroa destructor]
MAANTYHSLCRWVPTCRAAIPPNAVNGGTDSTGETLYIGRTRHEDDLIPGKVVPSHECCYVSWGGLEKRYDEYEILVAEHDHEFTWASCQGGELPTGAIQGGVTGDAEKLFIGRAEHDGSLTIGKVHPSHKVCYIPYDGKEIPCEYYEVLACKSINLAS